MAEETSLDRERSAVLIMDHRNRQPGFFLQEFRKDIVHRASGCRWK